MPNIKETATLEYRVKGADRAAQDIKKVRDAAGQTASGTERNMTDMERSMSRGFASMARQYISFAAAFTATTKTLSSGIGFNKFVENQTMSFSVMMKSADKAKQQMKDLYDFAVNSPLTFKETASSSKQLMAYGFTAKELIPTMKSLGTVAIATGHSLDDIAYVYGTLRSQGRAYSRDLMQFGMRGIPIYEELAKVMGVPADKIQKMASEGKIGFKQVEQAFKNMTTGTGRFAGTIEGYMNTLTGKTSMLTDMWEQATGRLTTGIFAQLKLGVEDMIKVFEDPAFGEFLDNMSNSLGDIAGILREVVVAAVQLLPIITQLVKAFLLFKGAKLFTSLLTSIPKLTTMFLGLVGKIALAGTQSAVFGKTIVSAVSMAISSLKLLMGTLTTFIAANPWILALIGVGAAGMAVYSALKKNAEEMRTSANPADREKQLSRDLAGTNKYLEGADVGRLAQEYQLTEGVVARVAMYNAILTEETWKNYLNTKSANKALEEQKRIREAIAGIKTTEAVQAEFLSGLTGDAAERYYDPKDAFALGGRGAQDYIDGFARQMQELKDTFGASLSPEQVKDQLQKEYDALGEALVKGFEVPKLFEETSFDEVLQARRRQLEKLLGSGSGKKLELKQINDFWLDQEWAVKRTISALDDYGLEMRKTLASAKAEIAQRAADIDNNIKYYKSIGGHEKEINALQAERNRMLSAEAGILQDISDFYSKKGRIYLFDMGTSGNDEFFENLKSSAVEALQGAFEESGTVLGAAGQTAKGVGLAMATGTKGTEAGNIASSIAGGGGIIGVIISLVSSLINFLSSIDSANKALNPLTTMLEAGRDVLEPLIDAASGPLVSYLTQFGDALADVMEPILQIWHILEAFSYIINIQFLAPLQAVGDAMRWIADKVIVPVGNKIIDTINAVIKMINKLPGVDIDYLDRLQTSVDRLANVLNADILIATMEYAARKLNDLIDDQIKSLQDLYEVGAIMGAEYESRVADLNAQKVNLDEELIDVTVKQMTTIQELSKWIQDNMGAYLAAKNASTDSTISTTSADIEDASTIAGNITGAVAGSLVGSLVGMPTVGAGIGLISGVGESIVSGFKSTGKKIKSFFGFDSGTSYVPYDMTANIHKGEGIIPASFMDSIRSGDLSLSGGDKGMGGQQVNVYVTVEGSVRAENELADTIATKIYARRKGGILTV